MAEPNILKNYFEYNGTSSARCRNCDRTVSRSDGSTSAMKKHLKTHSEEWKKFEEEVETLRVAKKRKAQR